MPTIRLVASHFDRSSTSRVTVTNEANMYNNTDNSANYTTVRGRNQSTSTYNFWLNGFNFSAVPANAIVDSFAIKIKAYRSSNLRTGDTYRLRLTSSADTSSFISGSYLEEDITTTAGGAIYTFPTGSLTWAQLSGYGSGFSINVPLRSTDGSYPYIYIYGAEIIVNYTLPVTCPARVKSNGSWVTPAKVLAKQNGTWKEASKILVKDGGSWK